MYDALRDSLPTITERQRQVIELIAAGKLGVTRRRQIPVAYRALTGDDPLARSLESAAADSGG